MVKRINLALQGGGAHGAFTWGVLDRLLEDDGIEIAAISGTSAGAMNGAALKSGWLQGGRDGARDNLNWLWAQIGAVKDERMPEWLQGWSPDPALVSRSLEYSLPYMWGDMISRMMSPYSWGPLYRNPLEKIVEQFRFEQVCAHEGPELFVCATNVQDGKIRIFQGNRISASSILASACLPTVFQAVECEDPISGETAPFWDGGYTGNPALFPLYDMGLPNDVLVVNINPLYRDGTPVTPPEIQNRINEISFNSSLLRELRAIDFVQRLIAAGNVKEGTMKNVRVHMIADDALMNDLSVATKLVPVASVLSDLREAGRRAAEEFLSKHRDDLNQRQTVDLAAMFG